MSMKQPIRWGILSTARISHQFARDFGYARGGELVAVASRSLDKARDFASQYGIPRAHGSYEDLYADPEVDAVYISTPNTHHYTNAMDAILAGKAVLCEKPLTVNPAEARSLIEEAAARRVYLMEAMWTWALPAIRQALFWVETERIGEVRQIKADFGYPMPYDPASRLYSRDLGGGCVLDLGVYPVALAALFFDGLPTDCRVHAQHALSGVEDEVEMNLDFGDRRAVLAASFRRRLPNAAYIEGDEGLIVIPEFWKARSCHLYRQGQGSDHYRSTRKGGGFEHQIEAVNRDLQASFSHPEVVTWADSLRFQDIMARVLRESERDGK